MAMSDDRLRRLTKIVLILVLGLIVVYFVWPIVWYWLTGPTGQVPTPPVTPTTPVPPTPSPTSVVLFTPTPIPPGRPIKTILHWRDPTTGQYLDGNVLNPGKAVELEEVYKDDIGPKYFVVFEVYDARLDKLMRRFGGLVPKTEFNAIKVQNWIARSRGQWTLPGPPGFRGHSTFLFRDERQKWSSWITSTSVGKILWRREVGFGVQIGQGEPEIVKVKGEDEIEAQIKFASDPEVCLVLLVPWGSGEANLENYLLEYLEYLQELNTDIRPEDIDGFVEHVREYLPSERPEGWGLTISPQTITGGPFDAGWFTLTLTTPTTGKTFLAVKAIDCEDPSRFVVSEIVAIEGAPY